MVGCSQSAHKSSAPRRNPRYLVRPAVERDCGVKLRVREEELRTDPTSCTGKGSRVRLGWSSGCAEVAHSPGFQRGWQGTPKFLVALPPPPRQCALLGIELVAAKSSVRTSLSCPPWPCTRFVHARTGFNLLMRRVACSRVWRRRVGRVPPPSRPRRGQQRPCVVDVLVDR